MSRVEAYLTEHREAFLEEFREFLAIHSVSTETRHAGEVRRAAEWLAERLRRAGPLTVSVEETERHPLVYAEWKGAEWKGAEDAPTVLVYGHYDVQPAEPLAAWNSPPFEPTVREGRIFARGASDDKGTVWLVVCVLRAFFAVHGTLPVNLKILFEGEEEIGSPSLAGFVAKNAERLEANLVLSADGGMWSAQHPTMVTSSRGMAGLEFTLHGPAKDLHSGRHGGCVANPLHAIAELVATLHDGDGRVAVDGFYEQIEPLSKESRELVSSLPFDEAAYLAEVGSPELSGERGYHTLERQWYRPTLEVNGMWGGYLGEGSKTVLPSSAHAKVTCRLVAGQEPNDVLASIERHLQRHCPKGVQLEIVRSSMNARHYRLPHDFFGLRLAEEVLESVYGVRPWKVGMGGTLPISQTFRELLGVYTVFFSFAVGDENIHGPNEFFRLRRFDEGMVAWARYLEGLVSAT